MRVTAFHQLLLICFPHLSSSFIVPKNVNLNIIQTPPRSTRLNLTPLPKYISPFEKSLSKSIDIQADFRTKAKQALQKAISDDLLLLEFEFPPLIGGQISKSQFDDFDNIQEMDKNSDWCVIFSSEWNNPKKSSSTWLVFPDAKECELAKQEWPGSKYQSKSTTFTTLESTLDHLVGQAGTYESAWGASFAKATSKITGTLDKRLGDESVQDELIVGVNSPPDLMILIQPGNGGPVEDWINAEKIHEAAGDGGGGVLPMVIVNGALDKVRGGYYPGVFFPKLAGTVDRFYKRFESVFYLKPLVDKGLYGWLYRVYPEPWQVVLQTVKTDEKRKNRMFVEDTVVYVSDKRPSFNEAVQKLVEGAASVKM